MSVGAVFKLIANDGKADRMIMATALLGQRIRDAAGARARAGAADTTPTLADLERTHILYVNAHFKPFAAIGFEYNKVLPQSGNPVLGGGVTFSIPQFGDFFHDMVVRVRLSAAKAREGLTPLQAEGGIFPINSPPQNPAFPDGGGDPALLNNCFNIVDICGNVVVPGGRDEVAPPVKYRNHVRYCEYPGNRIFNQVRFDVNGNPLDQYDTVAAMMLEKFCVPPGKRAGYDRLCGQQVPIVGLGGPECALVTDADAGNTPGGITKFAAGQSNQTVGLFYGAPLSAAAVRPSPLNEVVGVDVFQRQAVFVNGPQTPKPVQPPLEIWNKLRFWFCDDVRLAIPSAAIPFGQRFVSIELAEQGELAFEYPSIFLEATSFNSVYPGAPDAQQTSYAPLFAQRGLERIHVERFELYINNIFVNPEVHDVYIRRIGFSLVRVFRQHTQRCNQSGGEAVLLSQLKWPLEYMFVGLRPTWNLRDLTFGAGLFYPSGGNANKWRDWHRLTRLVDAACTKKEHEALLFDRETEGTRAAGSLREPLAPFQYFLPVPTVDSLTLTSHGVTIFDGLPDAFFGQYLPYHYGGAGINTPDDPGALFVNMALFPRSYQPSGHLNVSRARETYLKWTTSYVSPKTPADLLAVAVAINFLLVADGSAVLRYST